MGNIVWLASYPKSGNTWMRALLTNLFKDPGRPVDINELSGSLSQGESSIGWYRVLEKRPVEQWTQADVSRMRPRVHQMIAQGRSGSVLCKTHNALMNFRGMPTVNMNVSAGAIYIVRNPLDVVLSFADFQGVSVDAAIGIMATENFETPIGQRNVSEVLGSWSQHVRSWTASKDVHVVRYEDMLEDTVKAFAGVTKVLGLNVTRDRLERAVKNSSFKVLRGQEDQHGFQERPAHQERFFRKGTAGQWREELTAEQIARVCEAHREQMERFGYLPDAND